MLNEFPNIREVYFKYNPVERDRKHKITQLNTFNSSIFAYEAFRLQSVVIKSLIRRFDWNFLEVVYFDDVPTLVASILMQTGQGP